MSLFDVFLDLNLKRKVFLILVHSQDTKTSTYLSVTSKHWNLISKTTLYKWEWEPTITDNFYFLTYFQLLELQRKDQGSRNVYIESIKENYYHSFEYLLNKTQQVDIGLELASQLGRKRFVQKLIYFYGDSLQESIIHSSFIAAVSYSKIDIVELLLPKCNLHYREDLALRIAVKNGNLRITKILLEGKANVKVCGDEPLLNAVLTGNLQMAKVLVDYGANASNHVIQTTADTKGFISIRDYLRQNSTKAPILFWN